MTLDFYWNHLSPPSRMVYLFAKHLGVDLNVKVVDLGKKEQLKPDFLAINPAHTVPVLVDNGFAMNESRPMLMYLQNNFGKDDSLYPKDSKKRAIVDMRLFFDVSTLYNNFGQAFYPVMFEGQSSLDQEKLKALDVALGYTEGFLEEAFVAGDTLTIADFAVATTLSTIKAFGHDLSKFPRTSAYLTKCSKEMQGWDEVCQPGADGLGAWYKSIAEKL